MITWRRRASPSSLSSARQRPWLGFVELAILVGVVLLEHFLADGFLLGGGFAFLGAFGLLVFVVGPGDQDERAGDTKGDERFLHGVLIDYFDGPREFNGRTHRVARG
jgi:hypothetical protein